MSTKINQLVCTSDHSLSTVYEKELTTALLEDYPATMDSSRSHRSARQPQSTSRFSARYLSLIYNNTSPRFDYLEIQRIVSKEQAQCAITCVQQIDHRSKREIKYTTSYHVFVDFAGKRFQTRNSALFDVQGHRPEWRQIRSVPAQVLSDMLAAGDVVWDGVSKANNALLSPSVDEQDFLGASAWEGLGSASNEEDFMQLCQMHIPDFHGLPSSSAKSSKQSKRPRATTTSVSRSQEEGMKEWQEGYRAGFRDGMMERNKWSSSDGKRTSTFDSTMTLSCTSPDQLDHLMTPPDEYDSLFEGGDWNTGSDTYLWNEPNTSTTYYNMA